MENLSPLAWVAIGVIIVVAVAVNVWMVSLLKNKDAWTMQMNLRRPPKGPSMQNMEKFVRLLRNPWIDEEEQLSKLSKMVNQLKDENNQH